MTLSELVQETFAPNKEWHRLFMVWLQCWMEARHGRLGRTNGDIAKATGLQRTHVRKCLGVLRDLGLVDARRTHGNSGFDLILVTRTPTPAIIETLRDVVAGRVELDLKAGEVREVSTGGRRSLACRPVLEMQYPSGVHFVDPDSSGSTSGTGLASYSNYGTSNYDPALVTSAPTNCNQQDHSNISQRAARAAVAGPAAQPTERIIEVLTEQLARAQRERDELAQKIRNIEAGKRGSETAHTPADADETAAMQEVFDHWRASMGYQKQNLTKDRRKVILGRLRGGFSVDDLKAVITWASTDPWCRGTQANSTRAFDDLDNIMGNPTKTNKNLLAAGRGARNAVTRSSSLLGKPGQAAKLRTL